MLKNIILVFNAMLIAHGAPYEDPDWNGKWFPHSPSEPDMNPKVSVQGNGNHLFDAKHGIVMGVKDPNCDDGKVNLKVDWYHNPENYTCYEDKRYFLPRNDVESIHTVVHIPASYSAPHKCMNESIHYKEIIPTFGTHRPLWAEYGEYTFLPRQRWIHNLEHGAVVMLYHPCADKNHVNHLKKLVKSCLYRHVITPYNLLSPERPIALVTWGHRLEISKVAPEVVVDFIRRHALNGPEKVHRDGQYNLMLVENAKVVSTPDDSNLCPNFNSINMK